MVLVATVVVVVVGAGVVLFITGMMLLEPMVLTVVVVVVVLEARTGRPAVDTDDERENEPVTGRDYENKFRESADLHFSAKSSGLQQTLKTTFMLCVEHRPPMRRCRSSRDEVAVWRHTIKTTGQKKAP